MRFVQLTGTAGRRVALVEEPHLRLLDGCATVLDLARRCLHSGTPFAAVVEPLLSATRLPYDEIYAGSSSWRLLPAVDYPEQPERCMVSGTGLTHLGSAANRHAMHASENELTDSMRMYRWGVQGGRPEPGTAGVAPEWFYKGTGSILRAHGEALTVPAFAEDGGEEPEVAGVYLVADDGIPRRIGFTTGNEFSDHVVEKKNYLYLAASKLRECSIGPELAVEADFNLLDGEVAIERAGQVVWSQIIRTGEQAMSHSLANLEHHHFKFAAHRRPGDLHVHFFGAAAFSFGSGLRLETGDVMQVRWEGLGRPLRNPIHYTTQQEELRRVQPLATAVCARL